LACTGDIVVVEQTVVIANQVFQRDVKLSSEMLQFLKKRAVLNVDSANYLDDRIRKFIARLIPRPRLFMKPHIRLQQFEDIAEQD